MFAHEHAAISLNVKNIFRLNSNNLCLVVWPLAVKAFASQPLLILGVWPELDSNVANTGKRNLRGVLLSKMFGLIISMKHISREYSA